MKPVSETTFCVVDHGLGLPVAERLARDAKRVLYFAEWAEGFPTVNKRVIGDGIPNVERCFDFWEVKKEVDVFVFPDIQYAGEQVELASQGFAVWGARHADELELDRELFLKVLKRQGLSVAPHKVVVGITALREYLNGEEDKYIKVSWVRGSFETRHWRNYKEDAHLLDLWATVFGGVREQVRFIVFDSIPTELELGTDTYCIDGLWPDISLNGVEWKDRGYMGIVRHADELPEPTQAIQETFGPVLKKYGARCFWSSEVRVTKDDFFFLDPTPRIGLPSSSSQMELWGNFSEIVNAGAHGICEHPQREGEYSLECILKLKGEPHTWRGVEVPEDLKQWCKLANRCQEDGVDWFPPSDPHQDEVGWLVAIGDTPDATLQKMKEQVAMLPDGLSADITSLADIIKEVETAEDEGIDMAKDEMPEPSEVIDES